MKTFLVTGGAGFIGSNFVHHLFHKYPDYRILVLDLLTYAGSVDNLPTDFHDANTSGRIEFWYGDVRNASLVDNLVRRADVVVHFAAETHVTRSIFDNHHFFETDVLGTQVISNAVLRAEKVDRFIHISTSEVYGTADTTLMDEQHPLMPLSPYAAAKAGADRLVYSYWATYQLPVDDRAAVQQLRAAPAPREGGAALRHQLPARRAAPRAWRRLGRRATGSTCRTPARRSTASRTATSRRWSAK